MNDTITISAWMHFWLETFVRPVAKPAGYAQYADLCTKHIAPAIGAYVLREVTPAMLQQFLNQQAATGNLRSGGPLSAKSIKNLRANKGLPK